MGQYWKVVNLKKREFLFPHKQGCGLKLWEQLANHPGTGAALLILCAAMPEARGGGDFDLGENWHGPERTIPPHNVTPGPMPENYEEVARATIGRWAGDPIALVGDCAERGDLPAKYKAEIIYSLCRSEEDQRGYVAGGYVAGGGGYTDISDMVALVIEHELRGKFTGDGWKAWDDGYFSLYLDKKGSWYQVLEGRAKLAGKSVKDWVTEKLRDWLDEKGEVND